MHSAKKYSLLLLGVGLLWLAPIFLTYAPLGSVVHVLRGAAVGGWHELVADGSVLVVSIYVLIGEFR